MKSRIAVSLLFALIGGSVFASDATAAFEKLKTSLASWVGKACDGHVSKIPNHIATRASVLVSEIQGGEDYVVTMIHGYGERLLLTHGCMTANHPDKVGAISLDGKAVTFDFLDTKELGRSQKFFNLIGSDPRSESVESAIALSKRMLELLGLKRAK